MRRSLTSLFALALVMVALLAFPVTMDACEEEYFTTWCEYQCDFGIGYCWEQNENRCCWEHVSGGSCGEGAIYTCSECQPGGCGF